MASNFFFKFELRLYKYRELSCAALVGEEARNGKRGQGPDIGETDDFRSVFILLRWQFCPEGVPKT